MRIANGFLSAAILGSIVAWSAIPADATLVAKGGLGCWNSGMVLQQNLPMSDTSRATDIVDIVGFGDFAKRSLNAGWLYTNRRGEKFIEVRKGYNDDASAVLATAGAPHAARAAGVMGFLSFVPVTRSEAAQLVTRLRQHHELYRCFRTPLR